MTRRTSRRISTLDKKDADSAEAESKLEEGGSGAAVAETDAGSAGSKESPQAKNARTPNCGAALSISTTLSSSTARDAPTASSTTSSTTTSSPSSSSSSTPKLEAVMEKVRIGFALELAMGNWKLFKSAKHVVLDRDPPPPPGASEQKAGWEAGEKLMSQETVLGKVEKIFENEIEAGDWAVFTTDKHIIMELRVEARKNKAVKIAPVKELPKDVGG